MLSFDDTYRALGRIVTNALEGDATHAPRSQTGRPQAAPGTTELPAGRQSDEDADDFTIWERAQAKRIAAGIQQAFDVEYAPDVVVAVANVRRLAQDIVEARRLLDPHFHPNLAPQQ